MRVSHRAERREHGVKPFALCALPFALINALTTKKDMISLNISNPHKNPPQEVKS
jgi:hypothetical protein